MENEGVSPNRAGDGWISTPGGLMVGSPDGREKAIFSGPRGPIGGVLVKLSRCTRRFAGQFSAEKSPLLSGVRNKIKDVPSDPNPKDDGGSLSYVV